MDDRPIAWTESLLVGEPMVDTQHRRLIELIAALPEHETDRDSAVLGSAPG